MDVDDRLALAMKHLRDLATDGRWWVSLAIAPERGLQVRYGSLRNGYLIGERSYWGDGDYSTRMPA